MTDEGVPKQSMREEFPRKIRGPPHRRGVEGGERWAEQHIPQPHSLHGRWPPATQWSQDGPEYDEDGYIVGTRTQNWQDGSIIAPHWQDDGIPYNSRRGGPWRERMPVPRQNAPRFRYPPDRGHLMDRMYIDRDSYEVHHPQQRSMYQEGEHHGYARPPNRYVDNQPLAGNAPPSLPPFTSTLQAHPFASTGPLQAPAHVKEQQPACTTPIVEDVYSFESFNPQSSTTKSMPSTEDIVQATLSPKKRRQNVQLVYEKEEAERIARGLKPFRVECDSAGMPVESGRAGYRFIEVLRAFCIVYLDVSIIKVRDQNIEDYARVRENVESECECIGHPISEDGFKKAVSKCMKGERSRLHKLYMTRPERECPPKEQLDVWERLKTYWNSPEFGKVAKAGSATPQTATTSRDVPVSTGPCYTVIQPFFLLLNDRITKPTFYLLVE